MMWNSYFEYKDGHLYWRIDPSTHINKGTKAGTLGSNGYIRVRLSGKMYQAHRIVYEMHYGSIPTGMYIDHINGVKHDNRVENLQCVTPLQNVSRRTDSFGSRFIKRTQKYEARKQYDGKRYSLGHYGTLGGAYMANRMFFVNRGA